MSEDKPKRTDTMGRTSLVMLLLIAATYLALVFQSSLPQYQGEAGWAIVGEFYLLALFVWLPLVIASLVTAIIAIVKNKGRTQGIIVLSIIGIPLLLMLAGFIFSNH